jgi:hypothetical protein
VPAVLFGASLLEVLDESMVVNEGSSTKNDTEEGRFFSFRLISCT